ncbi:MAG: sulfatase [Armatimonadetes bacterium]|nr:sulfatase [Armatimonadota bacterium]
MVVGPSMPARVPPPNIVVFVVDDMGWQDTSVPFWREASPFNRRYRTPAMERLAREGLKFTSAYAACPVCTPTRASIMTGLWPARTGITNWTLRTDRDTGGTHPTLLSPEWNRAGLSNTRQTPRAWCAPTLPALLRERGYRTIHVGKAHWGAIGTPGADPRNLGFDVNIGGHAAGGPGSYLGEEGYGAKLDKDHVWDVPGLDKYHGSTTFLSEALTIEANREIDRAVADGKPFFLHLAHYAVHVPFAPDPRFYDRYRKAGLDHTEAMYAALVEGMDASLGSILANLDRHGIADNTAVIFVSDNGGLSAHGRGGEPHTHNAPLRSGKGSAYEGGIRPPMLVRWPGHAVAGSVCDAPVITNDIFATVLRIAGTPSNRSAGVPPATSSDGMDLTPVLADPSKPVRARALFWHYPHVWGVAGPGIAPFSAVRKGAWKLVYFHADGRRELYNVVEDIGETRDLSADHPAIVLDLSRTLARHLRSVKAQMPVIKATGKAVSLP